MIEIAHLHKLGLQFIDTVSRLVSSALLEHKKSALTTRFLSTHAFFLSLALSLSGIRVCLAAPASGSADNGRSDSSDQPSDAATPTTAEQIAFSRNMFDRFS